MHLLRVKIIEFVDDSQPGWVKCTFKDAYERDWVIVEKVPIVTEDDLQKNSRYPTDGFVGCEIISRTLDSDSQDILTINTEKPWGISEVNGKTVFDVFEKQVLDK